MNIAILYEDLEGYERDDPLTSWDATRWEDALALHLRAVEDALLLGPSERPNEVLHVVVLAGSGRPSVFGLPGSAEPLHAPQLLLSLENLDRISMAAHDPLRLWKYARASERLRSHCHVLAFGALDEFAAWNESQSYYDGDDARPTMLMVAGSHGRDFARRSPGTQTSTLWCRRAAPGSRSCAFTRKSTSRSTRFSTTSEASR